MGLSGRREGKGKGEREPKGVSNSKTELTQSKGRKLLWFLGNTEKMIGKKEGNTSGEFGMDFKKKLHWSKHKL